jgi:hypothetical protein
MRSSLILTLLATAACGADDDEIPFAQAATASDEALSMSSESAGFASGLFGDAGLPRARRFMACDPDPAITWTSICGNDYASSIELAWEDCTELREDASADGTLAVSKSITASNEACDDTTVLTINQAATGSMTLARDDGATITKSATLEAIGTRSIGSRPSTLRAEIDYSRSGVSADGEALVAAVISGEVDVVYAHDAQPPTETMNGELHATVDGKRGTHELSAEVADLVRVPKDVCRFPVSGSLEVRRDDRSRVLVFGPECGAATLDGEAVTLPLNRDRR